MRLTKLFLAVFIKIITLDLQVQAINLQVTPEMVISNRSIICNSVDSKICQNGGICADWGRVARMFGKRGGFESCICRIGFYGPHCEYKNEYYHGGRCSRVKRRWIQSKLYQPLEIWPRFSTGSIGIFLNCSSSVWIMSSTWCLFCVKNCQTSRLNVCLVNK